MFSSFQVSLTLPLANSLMLPLTNDSSTSSLPGDDTDICNVAADTDLTVLMETSNEQVFG